MTDTNRTNIYCNDRKPSSGLLVLFMTQCAFHDVILWVCVLIQWYLG